MDHVIIELTQQQINHNSNIHILKEKWYLFPEKDEIIELKYICCIENVTIDLLTSDEKSLTMQYDSKMGTESDR